MKLLRQKSDALSSIETALNLAPNDPFGLHNAAIQLMHLGEWDRAMAIWQKVSKLDPSPPAWTYWTPLGVHHHRGELEEAYKYALILKHETGGHWHWVAGAEAFLLADMGRMEEAREALDRALKQKPDLARTARKELENWWWANPDYLETMMNGLYKAGLERVETASQ